MLNNNLDQIASMINTNVAEADAKVLTAELGDSSIIVEASQVKAVCECLKTNDEYSFNSLQVITGVDYPDYIEVSYILNNIDPETPRQLLLKTHLKDKKSPELPSISTIWRAADWQERECFDMLGVKFIGHGDLRRILCPDDWEGFPLRKDYLAPKFYNDMEIYPEAKMNTEDREFAARQKMIQKAAKAKAKEAAAKLKAAQENEGAE